MALKDDFRQSNKLDPRLRFALMNVPDGADPEAPMFSALLRLDNAEPFSIPGATITCNMGAIFVARDISINGLKALTEHPRVISIEGGRALFPEQKPHSSGPKSSFG